MTAVRTSQQNAVGVKVLSLFVYTCSSSVPGFRVICDGSRWTYDAVPDNAITWSQQGKLTERKMFMPLDLELGDNTFVD